MTIPNEAFLSHSSLDHRFVTHLLEVLDRHGVPVWSAYRPEPEVSVRAGQSLCQR